MQFISYKFERIRERIAEGNIESARKRVNNLIREGIALRSSMACLLEKTNTFQQNINYLESNLAKAEKSKDPAERQGCIMNAMRILNSMPDQLDAIKTAAAAVSQKEKKMEKNSR